MDAHAQTTLRALTTTAWIAAVIAAPTPYGGLATGLAVAITTAVLLHENRRHEQALIDYGASVQANQPHPGTA